MRMQLIISGLICAGFLLSVTARPQSADTSNDARLKAANARQQSKINKLQRDIERLDAELDKKRRELNWRRGSIPHIAISKSKSTIIQVFSAYYGANLGRKDGFLYGDRLAIVHRSDKLNIVGFCIIDQLYDHDMMLIPEQDKGIHIDDEVYIINRDDSLCSLIHASLE